MVHKKKAYFFFITALMIFVGAEIVLRAFGFGENILAQEDGEYEYIAQPNQEKRRFGNRIYYNQFSMRSDNPIPGAIKILGLGDSVLNGGSLTSQEELATSLLSDHLTSKLGKEVQVLNISYKSWGPDNALAYLQKYGDFGAEMIFMVASSHDSFDTMTFKKVVGLDKNYPREHYSLATFEIVDAYFLPRLQKLIQSRSRKAGEKEISGSENIFNNGFAGLLKYARENHLPLIIYLHPEKSELIQGDYNSQGQLIVNFAKNNDILLLRGLLGAKEEYYRDNIHINKSGQKYLHDILFPVLENFLTSNQEGKALRAQ